jgi:hypothetical protein
MMFFEAYAKQLYIALSIALLFLFGVYVGYSHEKRAYDTFKSLTEANANIQEVKNAALVKNQHTISENITKEYAHAVDTLKSYYSNRPVKWLPINTPSGNVSDLSDTTKSANGTAKSVEPSAERVTELDCASDVLQLLALQKWIKQNLELK